DFSIVGQKSTMGRWRAAVRFPMIENTGTTLGSMPSGPGRTVMSAQLRCQLYPGQFSSEFTVIVESFNGRAFSLFAAREDVQYDWEPSQDQPAEGWLKVKILETDGNNLLLQLPQSTLGNGSYLAVRRDQLRFHHEIACAGGGQDDPLEPGA